MLEMFLPNGDPRKISGDPTWGSTHSLGTTALAYMSAMKIAIEKSID